MLTLFSRYFFEARVVSDFKVKNVKMMAMLFKKLILTVSLNFIVVICIDIVKVYYDSCFSAMSIFAYCINFHFSPSKQQSS